MSDEFIREVDEELRRDQVAQFWKKHSNWIIGAVACLVLGVAGYNFWTHQRTQAIQADAAQYMTGEIFLQAGQRAEGESRLEALAMQKPKGYGMLARFRLAASHGQKDPEAGAREYDELAANTEIESVWRDLARLRATALRLGGKDAEAAATTLETLAGAGGEWRHSARELLFAYAVSKNDYTAAGKQLERLVTDPETPPGIRQNLSYYATIVSGGAVQVAN